MKIKVFSQNYPTVLNSRNFVEEERDAKTGNPLVELLAIRLGQQKPLVKVAGKLCGSCHNRSTPIPPSIFDPACSPSNAT